MATFEGFSIPFFPSSVNILTWVATFLCMESSNNYPEKKLLAKCVRLIRLAPKDLYTEPLKFYPRPHLKTLLFVKLALLESLGMKRNSRRCLVVSIIQ